MRYFFFFFVGLCAAHVSHNELSPPGYRLAFGLPTSSIRCSVRSEEHTSELQSLRHLVCRLLLEKKKKSLMKIRLLNSFADHYFRFLNHTGLPPHTLFWDCMYSISLRTLLAAVHHSPLRTGPCYI